MKTLGNKKYVVDFDLKYGLKQRREHHTLEVTASDEKEAILFAREYAEHKWNRHAFHCKAKLMKGDINR